MNPPAQAVSGRGRWFFVLVAAIATIVLWPIAATFYSPTAIGYVQLPGVILFGLLAATCSVCFLRCPRRPIAPKAISFLLMAHAIYRALDWIAHFWLHSTYRA